MEGLYAAGETMGELFYYNYPGASSVIRGAVYGRIAQARMRRGGASAGETPCFATPISGLAV